MTAKGNSVALPTIEAIERSPKRLGAGLMDIFTGASIAFAEHASSLFDGRRKPDRADAARASDQGLQRKRNDLV